MAEIAEEKGDIEQAKTLLRKIIYLVPLSIAAYLELGSLYKKEGARERAKKMQETALELLEKLPSNAAIEDMN